MEKSQWDLKHVRFGPNRLTRMDDFVVKYQSTHIALLKEYGDSKRAQRKVLFWINIGLFIPTEISLAKS